MTLINHNHITVRVAYIQISWPAILRYDTFVHDFYYSHLLAIVKTYKLEEGFQDNKIHGTNMGPTWVLSAPDGPHDGPMNLAISVLSGAACECDNWKQNMIEMLAVSRYNTIRLQWGLRRVHRYLTLCMHTLAWFRHMDYGHLPIERDVISQPWHILSYATCSWYGACMASEKSGKEIKFHFALYNSNDLFCTQTYNVPVNSVIIFFWCLHCTTHHQNRNLSRW